MSVQGYLTVSLIVIVICVDTACISDQSCDNYITNAWYNILLQKSIMFVSDTHKYHKTGTFRRQHFRQPTQSRNLKTRKFCDR